MIRTILIGLDGSPYSEAAVSRGIRWARRFGAELVGLAILDEPTICKPEPVGIGGSCYKAHKDQILLEEARGRVHQFVERFSRVCDEAKVPFRTLERVGLPAEQIAAEGWDFDVTLLGQQTFFQFETQSGPDETLHQVLHHCHRPVVTVPLEGKDGESVVIAYDASAPSVRALEAYQASGLDEGKPVHVISMARRKALAVRHAEEGAKYLRAHNLAAQARPLPASGSPAEQILQEVRELEAGMLVMGVPEQSRLREFFFGCAVSTILQERDLPFLFLHS